MKTTTIKGKTIRQVAKQLGVAHTTILRRCNKLGIGAEVEGFNFRLLYAADVAKLAKGIEADKTADTGKLLPGPKRIISHQS